MSRIYNQWDADEYDFASSQFIIVRLPLYALRGQDEYVVQQEGRGTVVDAKSFKACLQNQLKLRSTDAGEVIRTADTLNRLYPKPQVQVSQPA